MWAETKGDMRIWFSVQTHLLGSSEDGFVIICSQSETTCSPRRFTFRCAPGDSSNLRFGIEVTCGSLCEQSYSPEVDLAVTAEEPTEFSATVTGLPFNLFGPWHKPGLLPKHGWSNFWSGLESCFYDLGDGGYSVGLPGVEEARRRQELQAACGG